MMKKTLINSPVLDISALQSVAIEDIMASGGIDAWSKNSNYNFAEILEKAKKIPASDMTNSEYQSILEQLQQTK